MTGWISLILISAPILLVLLDSILRLTYILFAKRSPKKSVPVKTSNKRLLFVIVARNEALVIKDAVRRIIESGGNGHCALAVVADNCQDTTVKDAEMAANHAVRVKVFVRNEGTPGKGAALAWFAIRAAEEVSHYDAIAIIDADSEVDPGFYQVVSDQLSRGSVAIQSFIQPSVPEDGGPALLAAYSELLSQAIDDSARAHLGWSVPLRGTGMVFTSSLFLTLAPSLETQVDDIELTLLLRLHGVKIDYEPQAVIYDPKANSINGLARQRGRWLKGQRQIWKKDYKQILRLIRGGMPDLSIIQALLLKPKTILVLIKILIFILLFHMPVIIFNLNFILSCLVAFGFLVDCLYYLYGLRMVPERQVYFLALLKSPVYLLVWLYGWIYSLTSGQVWLRARKE